MIDSLDAGSSQFLSDLSAINRRLELSQRQLSSGKKLNTVSDDPDQVSLLLQYRSRLDMNDRVTTDLGRVKTEVDTGENALATSVKLVEQARVLATQGATGTATADSRSAIATQLGNILQQLGSLANTTVEGRFIFSGDSDQTSPYTIDLTQAVPYNSYQGSTGTRQVLDSNGTLISIGKTAQDIFDGPNPGQSVFAAINNLRLAFQSNSQTAIDAAVPDIDSASTYLNVQHATYGSNQVQINDALNSAQQSSVRLKSQISGLEDADMTQAVLSLTDAKFQHDAALESRAKMPRNSLFDYLG